jgi:hypothetical protein
MTLISVFSLAFGLPSLSILYYIYKSIYKDLLL